MSFGCSSRTFLKALAVLVLAHCSVSVPALSAPAVTTAGGEGSRPKILVVGDSLSAEYGIARGAGWVALLDTRLAAKGVQAEVVNASISGDTTSGGRARLPALLATHRPAVVVIELGGNDALRGLPLASSQANLVAMTRAAKDAGAKVLIAGMQVPPNYGRRYAEEFAAMFGSIAAEQGTALVPFLLRGVADVPDSVRWFQPDRIHPRAEAHPRILDNVWPVLMPMLSGKLRTP